MALGFWLSEEMIFDPHTGRLLTDGTWEYKPPTAKVGRCSSVFFSLQLIYGHLTQFSGASM